MEKPGGSRTGSAEQHELFPAPTSLEAKSSEEIALRLQKQPEDLEAISILVRRHSDDVRRVCGGIVGSSAAEDVTQDVWVVVQHKIGQFRSESTFPLWLKSIARNQALNYRKREQHLKEIRTELTQDAEKQPTQSFASSSTLNQLDLLIRDLPEKLRVIIETRCSGDSYMTLAEVARRLGLSKTMVVERWTQAVGILKSAMGAPSKEPSV